MEGEIQPLSGESTDKVIHGEGILPFCICKIAKGALAEMRWWAPDSSQHVLHFLAVQADFFLLFALWGKKQTHVAHLQEALISSSESQTGTPDSVKFSSYPKFVCAKHIWKLFKCEFKEFCSSSYMVVLWVVLVLVFFS